MERNFNQKSHLQLTIKNHCFLLETDILACTHTEDKLTDFATDEFQTEEIRKSIAIVFLELLISRQMESERMIFNVARLISSLSRWLTFSARQRSGIGIARVLSCVLKMNWISHRHLNLNISKTELITLLPHHQNRSPPVSLTSTVASCHSSQRPSSPPYSSLSHSPHPICPVSKTCWV